MTLFVSQKLPDGAFTPLPLEFALIRAIAVFAPTLRSVLSGTIFVKVTLRFPLCAYRAAFLFHAINGSVAILVFELSHCLPGEKVAGAYDAH